MCRRIVAIHKGTKIQKLKHIPILKPKSKEDMTAEMEIGMMTAAASTIYADNKYMSLFFSFNWVGNEI